MCFFSDYIFSFLETLFGSLSDGVFVVLKFGFIILSLRVFSILNFMFFFMLLYILRIWGYNCSLTSILTCKNLRALIFL